MERIIGGKLMNYCEKNDLITEKQYGFRKNCSTNEAVGDVTKDLLISNFRIFIHDTIVC